MDEPQELAQILRGLDRQRPQADPEAVYQLVATVHATLQTIHEVFSADEAPANANGLRERLVCAAWNDQTHLAPAIQRLAVIADAWGLDNKPLIRFGRDGLAQVKGDVPLDLWEVFEQLRIRARNELAKGTAPVNAGASDRRGRPKISPDAARRRREMLDKWERAHEAGTRRKDFCHDEDISAEQLKGWQAWARKQKARGPHR